MDDGVVLGDARVLHPGKLRWLRAVGWMVLLFFALAALFVFTGRGMLWLELHAAGIPVGKTSAAAPTAFKLWGVIVAALVLLGGYALAVRYGENRRVAELALKPLLPDLIAGVLVGAVLMAVTIGVLWAAGLATVVTEPVTKILNALTDTVQSAVMEETLMRLVVFRLLWRAFGPWWALALSAALFGGLHLANPNASWFAAVCIAFEAGILLAAFYVLTGRAWASIGVHAGWNFTQGWVFGAAVSGTSGFAGGPLATKAVAGVPAWLSGGGFGPEASLPALLICTAAGVAVLWRARGKLGMGEAAAA